MKFDMSLPNDVERQPWVALLEHLQIDFFRARRHDCGPQWEIRDRTIQHEMLHILHKGEAVWTIDGQLHHAKPGDVVFCPPKVLWSTERVSTQLIQVTVVHFEARFPGGQRYLQSLSYPYLVRPTNPAAIEKLGKELCRWHESDNPARALKLRSLIFELFFQLFEDRGKTTALNHEAALALRVIEYLTTNHDQPITRQQLAREFLMNAHSLGALFRRYTGQSPIDYLIRLRLEKARQLLRSTEMSVNEVSAVVGYEDAAYFSRLFKQKMGMSPQSYRTEQLWESAKK